MGCQLVCAVRWNGRLILNLCIVAAVVVMYHIKSALLLLLNTFNYC